MENFLLTLLICTICNSN